GVLVPDNVSWGPPGLQVGMAGLCYQYLLEALLCCPVPFAVVMEFVERLEVEGQRSPAAVNLKLVGILATRGKTSSFKRAHGAVLEPGDKQGGMAEGHGPQLGRPRLSGGKKGAARFQQRALLDECLHVADHFRNLPDQEQREIDNMRPNVAKRATAGGLFVQAPHQRELGIDDPILEVSGAEVVNIPELSFSNHLPGKTDRRNTAI